MKKINLFSLLIISLLLIADANAVTVSHSASEITAGTFDAGDFAFQGNVEQNRTGEVYLNLNNKEASGRQWALISAGSLGGIGVGKFSIYDKTSGISRLAIDGSGNVGIGTTTPTAKLQIGSGTSIWSGGAHLDLVGPRPGDNSPLVTLSFSPSATKGWHQNADSAGNMNFHAFNGGTWPLVLALKENGNVGIGTASPTAPLEVKGGWPAVLVSGDSSPTLRIAGPGSTYKHMELKDSSNNYVWQFSHRPQSEQNRLDVWTFNENNGALTEVKRVLSINRQGQVGIGYAPDSIPSGWGGGLVAWDVVAKGSMRTNALCLGGSVGGNDLGECRSSWGGGGGSFGGMYRSGWEWSSRNEEWSSPYCVYANPFTGGCSCPSGFSASLFNRQAWARDTKEEAYYCYKIS